MLDRWRKYADEAKGEVICFRLFDREFAVALNEPADNPLECRIEEYRSDFEDKADGTYFVPSLDLVEYAAIRGVLEFMEEP